MTAVIELSPPEAPPAGAILLAYNLGPDGATFSPAITLTMKYDPADIPEGVAEEDLIIAYSDGTEWVVVDSVVDTVAKTVTAKVSHFTIFAVIGIVPPPVLAPAEFTSSALNISPREVDIGETVTISVLVTNIGEEEGSYTVTLKINGVVEQTREVTLAGGASQTVTFTTTKDEAGIYSVDVDGLIGSFTVREVVVPPPPINWPLIGGIIAAVVVVGLLIFFLVRRRAA